MKLRKIWAIWCVIRQNRAADQMARSGGRSVGRHTGLAGARAGTPGQTPDQIIFSTFSDFCNNIIQKLRYLYKYEIR